MKFGISITLASGVFLASCGYHTGGHSDLLPTTIRTIAIPPFTNTTARYKIVVNPAAADVILHGAVTNYTSAATVFDPTTGRASAVDIHIYLRLSLEERATGKILFTRPFMDVRERYQISVDPGAFFEESDDAVKRASEQTAQQVVSAILNNF